VAQFMHEITEAVAVANRRQSEEEPAKINLHTKGYVIKRIFMLALVQKHG
jgi:hypothetical protein